MDYVSAAFGLHRKHPFLNHQKRRARNLALACLLEAVRSRHKTIDIDNVNRVLIQPHWRIENDLEHIV